MDQLLPCFLISTVSVMTLFGCSSTCGHWAKMTSLPLLRRPWSVSLQWVCRLHYSKVLWWRAMMSSPSACLTRVHTCAHARAHTHTRLASVAVTSHQVFFTLWLVSNRLVSSTSLTTTARTFTYLSLFRLSGHDSIWSHVTQRWLTAVNEMKLSV